MTRAGLNVTMVLAGAWFSTMAFAGSADVFYEQRLDPYPLPIILPVRFGDHVYPFMLDTGSSRNLCDPSLSGQLGPAIGRVAASTPAGIIKVPFYGAPPISVGRGLLPPMPMGLEDFSGLRKATGYNIRGIMGAQSFKGTAIWLDYDHRSLKLARHVTARDMQCIDLEYGADDVSPYVTLDVAGRKVRFCIDLGFNGVLGLSRETCSKFIAAGIIKEYKGGNEVSITMGGRIKNQYGRFVKGELLGRKLGDVSITSKGDFNMLGVEFLVNYNVIIDLEKSKFYYKPRKAAPPINVYAMLGAIMFCDDGCGLVYQLRAGGGPARAAGLRNGDRVIRLGPIIRGGFNATALYELGLRSAGKTLDVEVQRPGWREPFFTRLRMGR